MQNPGTKTYLETRPPPMALVGEEKSQGLGWKFLGSRKEGAKPLTLLPLCSMEALRWPPGLCLWSPSTTCGRPALYHPAPSLQSDS